MTVQEMHIAFRLGLDKSNSSFVPAYEPEEIDYWLNFSLERFIKQRLFGTNTKKTNFPNDTKRQEDLYPLLVQNPNLGIHNPMLFPITVANVNTATSPLPRDFYHLIHTYATYEKTKDPYNGRVFTRDLILIDDNIYKALSRIWGGLTNTTAVNGVANTISFNKHAYYRLLGANDHSPALNVPSNSPYPTNNLNIVDPLPRYIQVFLPSFSRLKAVGLSYIRKWRDISILSPNSTIELPEHTHQEIVDIAVNTVLENLGDPRYQSNTNELNKQE
jgi:hypothetical protein